MKKLLLLSAFILLIGLSVNYFPSKAQIPQAVPTPCEFNNAPCPEPTPPVASIVLESVNSPLDGNPNLEGGKRIFPDKDNPNEQVNRQIVKVTAKLTSYSPLSLTKITFKTFDVDDPSTSSIIDSNRNLGDDNKGSPISGTLSFDATTSNTSDTVTVQPDEDGVASAYLTVTMQPGDNFVVVATSDPTYLNNVSVDGTGLKHSIDGVLPTIQAKRTEMLTVWRRLHIEVDSMEQVHENYVRGNVSGNFSIKNGGTKTINVTSPNLEINSFENGRLELASIVNSLNVISNTANTVTVKNLTSEDIILENGMKMHIINSNGSRSALGIIPIGQTLSPAQTVVLSISSLFTLENNLFANGSMFITPILTSLLVNNNTGNSIEVKNTNGRPIAIQDGTYFRLYDDDDMDDGFFKNGDEGIDVPMPPTENWIQDSDNPNLNRFAPAYIRPTYDIGDNNDKVSFLANVPLSNVDYYDFDQNTTANSSDFWTVYLIGTYQFDSIDDCDPYEPDGFGCTYGATELTTRLGSTVFAEVGRPTEYPVGFNANFINRGATSVHEIGHLFLGDHEDGGLMADPTVRTSGTFSPTTIHKIRDTTFP